MGGIGALLAPGADQSGLEAVVDQPVEDHPLQAMLDDPGAELAQHGEVEAGIGQLPPQRVLPRQAVPHRFRGLPVCQVLGELQDGDQRQHRRGHPRGTPHAEGPGERLVGEHFGQPVTDPDRQTSVGERRPSHDRSLLRDRRQTFGLHRHRFHSPRTRHDRPPATGRRSDHAANKAPPAGN
ncbi:hypothetical protein OHT74_40990 [Streptomyces sp. NBC_00354]